MKTIKEINFYLYGFKGNIINITVFFGLIFSLLMMIYIFFQPLKIEQQDFEEVPLFELRGFIMYELNPQGLKTVLLGESSKRFSDRYTVESINYTDNAKSYIANMKADHGIYRDEDISLDGNVTYKRDDGLKFHSQEAKYNKKTTLLFTDKNYIIHWGENSARGTSLRYNNGTNKITSKNIEATYKLQASNK